MNKKISIFVKITNNHVTDIETLNFFISLLNHIDEPIDDYGNNLLSEVVAYTQDNNDYVKMIMILLNKGANPTLKNKYKLTPIDKASEDCIKELLIDYIK